MFLCLNDYSRLGSKSAAHIEASNAVYMSLVLQVAPVLPPDGAKASPAATAPMTICLYMFDVPGALTASAARFMASDQYLAENLNILGHEEASAVTND